ncbi:MAG: hypothetical protein JSS83_24780, partial [Cyanobacteria bacterium SZAS LIN-3]|nr:hypothetical protein [Cyanobacteria bacterium SZAS LIN-3]
PSSTGGSSSPSGTGGSSSTSGSSSTGRSIGTGFRPWLNERVCKFVGRNCRWRWWRSISAKSAFTCIATIL